MVSLRINGTLHQVDVPPDMPLLWTLRDVIGLTGTKFGCAACLNPQRCFFSAPAS